MTFLFCFVFCSLSAHRLGRSQVCCVGSKPHQTFMKRQTDIINLSSPSVLYMLGCGVDSILIAAEICIPK